jgi:hypothetical protein
LSQAAEALALNGSFAPSGQPPSLKEGRLIRAVDAVINAVIFLLRMLERSNYQWTTLGIYNC